MSNDRMFAQLEHAHYIPTSPNEVLVKGGALEGFSLLVEDPERRGLAATLVRSLGAGTSLQELHESLNGTGASVTGEELEAFLDTLVEHGAIKEIATRELSPESSWSAFVRFGELPSSADLHEITVVASADGAAILEGAQALGVPVSVIAPDDVDWGALGAARPVDPEVEDPGAIDLTTIPVRRAAQLVLHLAMDGARAEATRVNERASAAGVPVLYAAVDGVDYRVGPYVVPGQTACFWEVERQWARASADRPQYETVLRLRERDRLPHSGSAVGALAASSALAPWLLELSLRRASSLAGEVIHGRATTTEASRHKVMRLPRCPVCLPLQPIMRNPLY